MLAENEPRSFGRLLRCSISPTRNVSRRVLLEQMIPNHDYILLCIILAWSGIGDIDVQHCQFRVTLFLFTNFVLLTICCLLHHQERERWRGGRAKREAREDEREVSLVRALPSPQQAEHTVRVASSSSPGPGIGLPRLIPVSQPRAARIGRGVISTDNSLITASICHERRRA